MTTTVLIDGRTHFGCTFQAFPDHPLTAQGLTFRRHLGGRGIDVPPLTAVADVEPIPVLVQMSMLVAGCPECAGREDEEQALVWREGPHLMLCGVCGNAGVGKRWRPVALPEQLAEIEAALACRPMGNRSWAPGQAVDDLEAQNRRFGWVPMEVVT